MLFRLISDDPGNADTDERLSPTRNQPKPPKLLIRLIKKWLIERGPALGREIKAVGMEGPEAAFGIEGAPGLQLRLRPDNLIIAASYQGEWWDSLLDLEVYPRRTNNGYICECCSQEGSPEIFKSKAELIRDHLLDPLECWIVDKLAVADRIAFYESQDGSMTWARLEAGDTSAGGKTNPTGVILFTPPQACPHPRVG